MSSTDSPTRVIAQATLASPISFPNFRLPTRVRVVADIGGGAGAPTKRAAESTPGFDISGGASGVYDIAFPPGKALGDVNPQVWANTPGTNTQRSAAIVDASTTNTNATTGKLRVVTGRESDGTPTALANGDVIDVCFTVEYG